MEVHGTEGSTIQFHETAVGERFQTVCADEAFWMPSAIGCSQVVLSHGFPTARTFGGKELVEVTAAVWFSIFLQETLWSKQVSAVCAEEMLRVPSLVQSCHDVLQYRPLAVGAAWRKHLMVVFLTVRPSLSLKEACCAQLSLTHHAHKVLRVPHFTQCCDHLSHNAFVACSTMAFGFGLHTNLLQIRAQPSQKVIYRICVLSLD